MHWKHEEEKEDVEEPREYNPQKASDCRLNLKNESLIQKSVLTPKRKYFIDPQTNVNVESSFDSQLDDYVLEDTSRHQVPLPSDRLDVNHLRRPDDFREVKGVKGGSFSLERPRRVTLNTIHQLSDLQEEIVVVSRSCPSELSSISEQRSAQSAFYYNPYY